MRRFNTITLVRDTLALSAGSTLAGFAVAAFFALLGGIIGEGDSAEVGTVVIFWMCLALWPLEFGSLLRHGWGRVVALMPISSRRGAWAILLLTTIMPVFAALVCSALIFLLLRMMQPVNWTLLLQWACIQYCVLSALFLLHAVANADYFPGILTGRSHRGAGWRYRAALAVHVLTLLAVMQLLGPRAGETSAPLAYALLALGAIFSALGAGRLRWITVSPRTTPQFRRWYDYLRRRSGPAMSAKARFLFRESRWVWPGLIARNALIAACLVLSWLLIKFMVARGRPEVSPTDVWSWVLLVSLSCYWAIQPAVRALRAIRLLPWSRVGLGCRLVSISMASLVTCIGLLTLAVFLVAGRETAEMCWPMLVGIAGAGSLIIPVFLHGGRSAALGNLFFNCWCHYWMPALFIAYDYRSWSNWSWYPAFGLVALALGMFFTWRAAAKARETLRPAMPAS